LITTAIGYVAPSLAKEWGVEQGPRSVRCFSAGLFGLMIGALTLGPLADRIGRKKIIIFSTAGIRHRPRWRTAFHPGRQTRCW